MGDATGGAAGRTVSGGGRTVWGDDERLVEVQSFSF